MLFDEPLAHGCADWGGGEGGGVTPLQCLQNSKKVGHAAGT